MPKPRPQEGKEQQSGGRDFSLSSSECFPLCLPVSSILSSQTLPNTHTHTHMRTHVCTHMHTHIHAHTHACMHTHAHVHTYTTSSFLLQSLFGAHGFSISDIVPNLCCSVMVLVSSHSLGLTQLVRPTLQGSARMLSTPLCQLCAQLS